MLGVWGLCVSFGFAFNKQGLDTSARLRALRAYEIYVKTWMLLVGRVLEDPAKFSNHHLHPATA